MKLSINNAIISVKNINRKHILNNKDLYLSFIILTSILLAYYIEYSDRVIPCKLCYIARYYYFFLAGLSLISAKANNKAISLTVKIMLFGLVGLSGYQILVGSNIVDHQCTQVQNIAKVLNDGSSFEAIEMMINNTISVPCNLEYKKFGIPITWANFVFTILLVFFYFGYDFILKSFRRVIK